MHSAIGFATAAVHGDHELDHELARRALALDADGFIDAVMTTIQAIADDADEAGADTGAHLQEIGLGIHLAALDEQRKRTVAKDAPRCQELLATMKDPDANFDDKRAARREFDRMPRDVSPTRVRSRGGTSGRPRGALT